MLHARLGRFTMNYRLSSVTAIIALTVVPLAGCGEDGASISDTISTSATCAELVEMSLGDLRDIQENVDNPEQVEKTLRKLADDFEEKAAEVDDAELQKGVDAYAAKVNELARAAESGETPDINDLVKANSDLADACS